MTGLEILAVCGDKARLFKVRHDGYACQEFAEQLNKPKAITTKDAILEFKDWFFNANTYGPEDSNDSDILTQFTEGFEFTRKTLNYLDNFDQGTEEIENIDVEDGFGCSYTDHLMVIDLDSNEFLFLNDKEEWVTVDKLQY